MRAGRACLQFLVICPSSPSSLAPLAPLPSRRLTGGGVHRQSAGRERRQSAGTKPDLTASHESKAMIGAIQGSVSVVAIIQLMYVTSLPVFADQVLRYFGLHSANTRLRAATALSSLRQHVKHQRILRTAILTVLHMKVKVSDFQQTPDPGGRPQASTRHRPSRHLL